METFLSALVIIAIIAAVIAVLKFIKALFTNFVISRYLSMICSGIAILAAFSSSSSEEFGAAFGVSTVTTILSWLYYIGPVLFDVEWDGTYRIDWQNNKITPGYTGGFIMNAVGATIVVFVLYGAIGSELPQIFFIVPIVLLLLNAKMLYSIYKR